MQNRWQHITTHGNCPDESTLRLYNRGELSAAEMFIIENHLASCQMCRDFSEGLAIINNQQLNIAQNDIKNRLSQLLNKETKTRPIIYFKRVAVAASILLMIGIASLTWIYFEPNKQEKLAYEPEIEEKKVIIEPSAKPASQIIIADKETKAEKEINVPIEILEVDNFDMLDIEDEFIELKAITFEEEIGATPSAENAKTPKPTVAAIKEPSPTIKGTVKEASTGLPIAGVAVFDAESKSGTITDINGNFEIKANNEQSLQFSMIGYKKETVIAKSNLPLNIEMQEELITMDEIVVVGYGSQKRSIITGAVTAATSKTKEEKSIINKYNEILKSNPTDSLTMANLALEYMQESNYEESLHFLEELTNILKNEENRKLAQQAFYDLKNENNRSARRNLNQLIKQLK